MKSYPILHIVWFSFFASAIVASAFSTFAVKTKADVSLPVATPQAAVSHFGDDNICITGGGSTISAYVSFKDASNNRTLADSRTFNVSDLPAAGQTEVANFRVRILKVVTGQIAVANVTPVPNAAGTVTP